VNTGRDLRDELGRQGSSIRRVLADLEVPEGTRRELEHDIEELSGRIMGDSATLKSVSAELKLMHDLVGSVGEPALNALPGNLDELSRLISIDLDTGSGPLPIRLHGAGSRSLSSLQVQGVLYSRRLGQGGEAVAPTPVTLVEEPEAHLHPQAAMELPELLQNLRGQKIVSTHSAHLVTAVEPRAIRLIQTRDNATVAVDLGPADNSVAATHRAFRPALHTQEMEKIRRLVERPFGELLFASSIVLGDGATERGFVPVVLRYALQHRSHGVATIDAGSLGNELAKAVVKFAAMTRMPCTLFADSDDAGVSAVAVLRNIAGDFPLRVVWINGIDDDGKPRTGAVEDMLLSFDEAMCARVCERVRPGLDGTTMHRLQKIKGSSGRFLAQELIDSYPSTASWPTPIRALIDTVGKTS
jgi:putative ATP-dependent endonuclease of OLD family